MPNIRTIISFLELSNYDENIIIVDSRIIMCKLTDSVYERFNDLTESFYYDRGLFKINLRLGRGGSKINKQVWG